MIATLSGEGRVAFKDSRVIRHTHETGDFIYVPAGTPIRILPDSPSIQYRYKGAEAGLEGVAWYCEECGHEIYREVWDTAEEVSQAAYRRIPLEFNDRAPRRKCRGCGKVHPKVDTEGLRRDSILATLAEDAGR